MVMSDVASFLAKMFPFVKHWSQITQLPVVVFVVVVAVVVLSVFSKKQVSLLQFHKVFFLGFIMIFTIIS